MNVSDRLRVHAGSVLTTTDRVLVEAADEIDRLRAELAKYRSALEQIVAPFEDLNFVSGNKLLTYIHDTATAALAAKGEHRPCTCHPNDNPPAPCPRRYALSECREAALAAKEEEV